MPKKVKRSFFWLQKVLEVLGQRTSLPGEVGEIIQPVIDTFGWERLAERSTFTEIDAAAPAVVVNGPVTPDDVLRLILHANVSHTDTGVSHLLWIDYDLRSVSPETVAINQPTFFTPVGAVGGVLDRFVTVAPGQRIRGRTGGQAPPVVGDLTLAMHFIDLPIGEYVAPV